MLSSIRMQATDNGTQPLWAVDLRPFSYSSRPNPHYIGGKAYIGGKFVDIGVLFPTSDEVICYFVTKADAGQLVRRNELTPTDPFVLQFVAFDAKTGALKFRKKLPARSGISSVVPGSPAVRRRTSGLYGSAPDHSWLQGVLESDDGRSYLRYADRAVDDPWGGKMALEDEPRLAAFRTGTVLMVEGEMMTSEEGQPVYDSYHYPRYRVRNVWRVPEKE